jgi:hypothetical protein
MTGAFPMRLTMQRVLLFALLLTPAMNATAQVTEQNLLKPDPNDWLQYSGTYDAQRHSLLKQIDTTNVQQLQTKWAYHMAGAADLEAVPRLTNLKEVMYESKRPVQSDVDKRFTPEEFQDLLAFPTRRAIAAPPPAPARNGQPQGN